MKREYSKKIGKYEFQLIKWEGQKGPVFCIHALTGNANHFQLIAKTLTPEYQVISYDLRGRGDSSPADKDSNVMKHADDAIAIMDDLGLKNPLIIGHSMGAYTAAIVASRRKDVRGLVLLDGAGVVTEQDVKNIEPALERVSNVFERKEDYIEGARESYKSMGLDWNEMLGNSVDHEIGRTPDGKYKCKGDPGAIHSDLISLMEYPHEKILPYICCPTLLVYAKGILGSAPLYYEKAYDKTKALIKNLDFYITEENHFTMMHKDSPGLQSTIKAFADKCFA
ncbi:alpha/beta fold hydrolase [Papillibacter cinnamivorans]|uniref:Pimeloyl-ACP methyl ester carboxylesterase n=1 Tax=Papillibacter cinnamivorans DSM 12816 TaxID=1122930 RepID=A0A1W1ZK50_9FIRM|nr:alpha/beta hydrolase [Papillibacter cinnamivorans]SMC48905.1 Pimeloyl-ACP methyl ester carboxylesterase [Papillibacter cinnamivorans DSM 12816]